MRSPHESTAVGAITGGGGSTALGGGAAVLLTAAAGGKGARALLMSGASSREPTPGAVTSTVVTARGRLPAAWCSRAAASLAWRTEVAVRRSWAAARCRASGRVLVDTKVSYSQRTWCRVAASRRDSSKSATEVSAAALDPPCGGDAAGGGCGIVPVVADVTAREQVGCWHCPFRVGALHSRHVTVAAGGAGASPTTAGAPPWGSPGVLARSGPPRALEVGGVRVMRGTLSWGSPAFCRTRSHRRHSKPRQEWCPGCDVGTGSHTSPAGSRGSGYGWPAHARLPHMHGQRGQPLAHTLVSCRSSGARSERWLGQASRAAEHGRGT